MILLFLALVDMLFARRERERELKRDEKKCSKNKEAEEYMTHYSFCRKKMGLRG